MPANLTEQNTPKRKPILASDSNKTVRVLADLEGTLVICIFDVLMLLNARMASLQLARRKENEEHSGPPCANWR